MHILYHHRTRAEDAQGIHIAELINAFKKSGNTVDVAGLIPHAPQKTDPDKESFISRIAAKAPPLIYECMEILYNIYGIFKLIKYIRQSRPNFIYERYALFNLAGVIVSKLYNIPLIEEVNAPLCQEKATHDTLVLKKTAAWCEKIICFRSFRTIVVSTPLKKIMAAPGIPETQFTVIPNGVNDEWFNPEIDGSKIRKKFNLQNKTIIGFVGWFRKWHGLESLLETYAVREMIKKNIHILLVGDGPAYDNLIDIAKKHDILNIGVTFTGPVERKNIPEYIAAFDIALQPDVTDYASPIKMFEYISMGKGVVAPKKDNITEILSDDYPGLFEPGNWQDMANMIIDTASSLEKSKKLSDTALRIFKEKEYLWKKNAERTIHLLFECCKNY